MNSEDLARYMAESDRLHQPWLLAQLRLKKLQEQRESLSSEEYLQALADVHHDLMQLGEWWVGREDEVF
ncbi:MAG: hypothetical protein OHK0037_05140 [Elainellaceae cyanobacterium]